jgi:gliding motility-associated-like protein
LNFTKHLRNPLHVIDANMCTRVFILLTFLIFLQLNAQGQKVRPAWVDNFTGSSGYSQTTYLSIDNQNNIYITGQYQGTVDFDPSPGVKTLTSAAQPNIFIGKYKSDGTLIWVESIAGNGPNYPYSLTTDKDGNVTIVGSFNSTTLDADPGPGVHNLNNPSKYTAAFIVHLDSNGNFLWANSFAGLGSNGANRVAADSQDNVVVTSAFAQMLTVGDSTYEANGASDGLIIKYGASGNLLWSIWLRGGNSGDDDTWGVAVDSENNIVISGLIDSAVNFNPLGSPYYLNTGNQFFYDSFVAKYSPAGELIWVDGINLGTSFYAQTAISVDTKNNIYFSSPFDRSITFGSTTLNSGANIGVNFCFARYSPAGVLEFAKSLGGVGNFAPSSFMSTDANSDIYLTGYFTGPINFNPNPGTPKILSPHGRQDIFVAKYDSTGNYQYAFNIGSANCTSAFGAGIGVDGNGNVDLAGGFCSTVNFDPGTCSTAFVTASTPEDAFLVQYASTAIANNTIVTPATSAFCLSGTPATITGSLPVGGNNMYAYQWQSSSDSVNFNNLTNTNTINYLPPPLTVTTFYRRIASSDTCSIPDTSNIVTLSISTPPSAPVVDNTSACPGSTATIPVISPAQGLTYSWYASATSDTLLFSGSSFVTPALTASATYYVAAVNKAGCISGRTPAIVSLLQPLPAPVVVVDSTTISSITFSWTAVNGANGYQVSTNNGQTYSAPTTGVTGLATTISGLQPDQSITLVVEAIAGQTCQSSAASSDVTGTTLTTNIVYVPNVFTPNGDGINDQVHVHGDAIKTMNFYIYDQWGELLFTSTNVQNGWDGTYRGKKEPVGVYVYYLQAVMNNGQIVNKKGTITLLK